MSKNAYVGAKNQYKKIEYLLSNSSKQYINTGYKPKSNTKIELKVYLSSSSSISRILGAGEDFCLHRAASSTIVNMIVNGSSRASGALANSQAWIIEYFSNSGFKATYASQNVTKTYTAQEYTSTNNLLLFAGMQVSTLRACPMRLYYCKIYEDNELKMDLIPVKDVNSKACLYDKISDTMFYNANGTTAFGAGPELSDPKEEYGGYVAKKIKNIYVGINSIARRVKKGYIGINGVARLFYQHFVYTDFLSASSRPVPTSWTKVNNNEFTATNSYGQWRITSATNSGLLYQLVNCMFNKNDVASGYSTIYSSGNPFEVYLYCPENISVLLKSIYAAFHNGTSYTLYGKNASTNNWDTIKSLTDGGNDSISISNSNYYTAFKITGSASSTFMAFILRSGTVRDAKIHTT